MLNQLRNQLTQLRTDLDNAVAQLQRVNPNDPAAVGLAVGAASNTVSALGNCVQALGALAQNQQLRAAINQSPECQNVMWAPASTTAPSTTGSSQPPG